MAKTDWLDRINNPQEGDGELLHAACTRYYWRDWEKALKAYLADPHDFYAAEWFMQYHPANQRHKWGTPESWWHENLWWHVTKVDPKTKKIATRKNPGWRKNGKGKHPVDTKRNTETNVWVEWGPYHEAENIGSHDPRTDTGGVTFEEAIVNLAHNVWKLYGANADVPHEATLDKKDRW